METPNNLPDGLVYVESPHVAYHENEIVSSYSYLTNEVKTIPVDNGGLQKESSGRTKPQRIAVVPKAQSFQFRTDVQVPRLGLMIVGWGGNNGSTLTAGVLANRKNLVWQTRTGEHDANYYGSLTQSSTIRVGEVDGVDQWVPFNSLIPMVDPNNLVITGWDINGADICAAARRAQVLEPDLIRQLEDDLKALKPLPSVYFEDFIAANQAHRADNVLKGTRSELLTRLRKDIQDFKARESLEQVVVLWTANTERFCTVTPGVHDNRENLMKAVEKNHEEISQSTLFALAAGLEGCCFINGSPQNTLVPGALDLFRDQRLFCSGDDFKTGQTKMKSALAEFFVGAGLKPVSVVSYNHLGNNDGKNLSAPQQFRSKEISKSSVLDDIVQSNDILYKPGETPDHVVVIKYVPYVGDSKRALDEYTNEIFLHGKNTIVMHNTCEDSLLAVPIMLDLVILTELFTRITYKTHATTDWRQFASVLEPLSYFLKAPLTAQRNGQAVNALSRQRNMLENIVRACVGLAPDNCMRLEQIAGLGKEAPSASLVQEATNRN